MIKFLIFKQLSGILNLNHVFETSPIYLYKSKYFQDAWKDNVW